MDFEAEKRMVRTVKMSCTPTEVEAGTTGLQGGDWSHGSRTYVRLRNLQMEGWFFRIRGEVIEADQLEILIGGDNEVDTFSQALLFAFRVISGDISADYEGKKVSHAKP